MKISIRRLFLLTHRFQCVCNISDAIKNGNGWVRICIIMKNVTNDNS